MALFKKKEKEQKPQKEIDIRKEIKKAEKEEEGLWIKCNSCKELLFRKEVERNLHVCPKCSYHFPISVENRIGLTFDEGSFVRALCRRRAGRLPEVQGHEELQSAPRRDKRSHKTQRRGRLRQGEIEGIEVLAAIFDFSFMGGSLGFSGGRENHEAP